MHVVQCSGMETGHVGTTKGQVMLVSMGNSGTDWFMRAYRTNTSCGIYFREFFNPHANEMCQAELEEAFGSWTPERCVRNIVAPWESLPTAETYQKTWVSVPRVDVTKETFMAFKLGFFAPLFDCFVLVRPVEDALPPSRPELLPIVDALFEALAVSRRHLPPELEEMMGVADEFGDGKGVRMVAAYCVMWRKMLEDAERYAMPVVRYVDLMSASEQGLVDVLSAVPGVNNHAGMAREIAATRRVSTRDFGALGAWKLAEKMAGLMGERIAGMVLPSVAGRKT